MITISWSSNVKKIMFLFLSKINKTKTKQFFHKTRKNIDWHQEWLQCNQKDTKSRSVNILIGAYCIVPVMLFVVLGTLYDVDCALSIIYSLIIFRRPKCYNEIILLMWILGFVKLEVICYGKNFSILLLKWVKNVYLFWLILYVIWI